MMSEEKVLTTRWQNVKGRAEYLTSLWLKEGDSRPAVDTLPASEQEALGMALCEELDRFEARIARIEEHLHLSELNS